MRNCLIVQFEPRHEEIIPSVIAACNGAGYKPTVLLNRRIRRLRGDIFAQVKGGHADIHYQPLSTELDADAFDWKTLLEEADFVLLNTMNRTRAAEWAKRCGKPVIAIIHNIDQFFKGKGFTELLDRSDFGFMTLGSHVTAAFNERTEARYVDKVGLLTSCVMSDNVVPYQISQPRKVVVQGNLSQKSRNYTGLIKALSANPGKWNNLKFEFPSSGADREAVAAAISEHGLDERIHILPVGQHGEIPYADVFNSFHTATMFHPLISEDFAQYQRIKITSTASMSVGFGVPMIMDRYSEACYRFPMLVSDNSVEASFDRLSEVEDAELSELNIALRTYRSEMMERSAAELTRMIGRVC